MAEHRTAMVFPGMGPTTFPDLGRFLLINPFATELLKIADRRLGYSVVDRFRDAEGDYSEYAQVAFFTSCLALARWAEQELGVSATVCTGASFGVKPAAVYAGSLSFDEGVWLTARVARCLTEYFATEHRDVVTHSFARTPADRLAEVLAELAARGEWYDISCQVDHDFHLVSVRERALDWLQDRVRALGGLPLYTMRPPMHSALFTGLRRKVEDEILAELDFAPPRLPVVSDSDGSVLESADGVRTLLLDSFVRPVRWPEAVATLRRTGMDTVCVAGPDSLFGRVGVTTGSFAVVSASPRLALTPRRRGAVTPAP
jgi:[acyl-carrier-protein] S-malonyltransferase